LRGPCFFFFSPTPPTQTSLLSLRDALPISLANASRGKYARLSLPKRVDGRRLPKVTLVDLRRAAGGTLLSAARRRSTRVTLGSLDRKSTRLNSSHVANSYAVFCLKKKKVKPAPISLTGAPALPFRAGRLHPRVCLLRQSADCSACVGARLTRAFPVMRLLCPYSVC